MGKYLLSYTAASLLVYEMDIIIEEYFRLNDWSAVQKLIVDKNLLEKGTISTRKRVYVELKRRIDSLNDNELAFAKKANSGEKRLLYYFSCLKTYRFIYEFMHEVAREKVLLFDYKILNSDYESFFQSKCLGDEKLNTISEKTKYKIKQVLFKILAEATIINDTKNKILTKPYLSDRLIKLIAQNNSKYLSGFLLNEYEIKKYKEDFT